MISAEEYNIDAVFDTLDEIVQFEVIALIDYPDMKKMYSHISTALVFILKMNEKLLSSVHFILFQLFLHPLVIDL